MFTALGTIRENIQAQGFCGLDDKTYAQINYPPRLSPAICMVWTAVGTALASPMILWALAPFAALGTILPGHPFDILYNYGLRYLTGTLSPTPLRRSPPTRLRLRDDPNCHGRMGFPGRHAHGRSNRRLGACGGHLREREHRALWTRAHCSDFLR